MFADKVLDRDGSERVGVQLHEFKRGKGHDTASKENAPKVAYPETLGGVFWHPGGCVGL
jgi:hypothetical protein